MGNNRRMFKKILPWVYSLATALSIYLLLLLPDTYLYQHGIASIYPDKQRLILLVICWLLTICGSPKWFLSILAIIGLLVFTEIAHVDYFGRPLNPISIELIFREWTEIFGTGITRFKQIFLPLAIIIICYGVAAVILLKTSPLVSWAPKLAIPCLLLILTVPSVQVFMKADKLFFVNKHHYPLVFQVLYKYSVAFESAMYKNVCRRSNFDKPIITLKMTHPRDIVVLMGESLSPAHMSVYGYEHKTTPWLDEQKLREPDFQANLAMAAGVATRSTLPLFFNTIHHPGDRETLAEGETNLFQLARANGFSTHLISAQYSDLMQGINLTGVNVQDRRKWESLWLKKKDLGLVDIVKQIPEGSHRFIVIQFRAAHSPYAEFKIQNAKGSIHLPKRNKTKREEDVDDYDNAVLLVDEVLKDLVPHLRASKNPTYIIKTADHSELLGENGLWGHNLLNLDVAKVPLITWAPASDKNFSTWVNSNHPQSHYEIALEIANLLGVNISSPRSQSQSHFINGSSPFGSDGYIEWKRENGKVIEVKKSINDCAS